MCDDHGLRRSGPTTLAWGRWALGIGALALPAVVLAIVRPEAAPALVAGPLVALAGWSFGRFLEAGAPGPASRLTGPAFVVGGAALAAGSDPAAAAVAVGVATLVLAFALASHPLFGRAPAVIGAALGVGLVALVPAGILPAGVATLAWAFGALAAGVRSAGAVRRLSRGYAPWPEPALV